MNFLNVPKPQVMWGWGSILGTVGGIALAGVTGGASIPIGAAIGGAIDSRNAEKKAAKQQVAGTSQANARLDPYNQLGLQSANTLAGLLGMPGINLPGGAPSGGLTPAPIQTQGINRAVTSQVPAAVRTVIANRQMQPQGRTLAQMRPPASGTMLSSYGGRV